MADFLVGPPGDGHPDAVTTDRSAAQLTYTGGSAYHGGGREGSASRKAREQEARRRQEEDHENEEEAYLNHQMGLLHAAQRDDEAGAQAAGSSEKPPRLSAQALRAWEDWEWHNILQEPPRQRRRTMLAVTMGGSQSVDGPG